MNSRANADNQNIAVNIWFRHDAKHFPTDCELSEEEASLSHFHFPGMDSLLKEVVGEGNQGNEDEDETKDEKEEEEEFRML